MMAAYFYPLTTGISLIVAGVSFNLWSQYPSIDKLLLVLVILGSLYDGLVISIGRFLNHESLLKRLNWVRFLAHSLCVPFLIVVVARLVHGLELDRSMGINLYVWSWGVAILLVGLDLWVNVRHLELRSVQYKGTVRYIPKQTFIPLPTIVTMVAVAMVGWVLLQDIQWPWLWLGSMGVILGNAIPARIGGPVVGTLVELVFLGSLLGTEWIVA